MKFVCNNKYDAIAALVHTMIGWRHKLNRGCDGLKSDSTVAGEGLQKCTISFEFTKKVWRFMTQSYIYTVSLHWSRTQCGFLICSTLWILMQNKFTPWGLYFYISHEQLPPSAYSYVHTICLNKYVHFWKLTFFGVLLIVVTYCHVVRINLLEKFAYIFSNFGFCKKQQANLNWNK